MKKIKVFIYLSILFCLTGCSVKKEGLNDLIDDENMETPPGIYEDFHYLDFKMSLEGDTVFFELYYGILEEGIDSYFKKYDPSGLEIGVFILNDELSIVDNYIINLQGVTIDNCIVKLEENKIVYNRKIIETIDLSKYDELDKGVIAFELRQKESIYKDSRYNIIIDKEVHSILSKQTSYKVVEFDKKSILLEPATSIDRIEYAG